MASDVINRQTIREALAAGIAAALDSTWDVYSYGTDQFGGKARNVVISSGNIDYPEAGAGDHLLEDGDADAMFNIGLAIKYADDDQSWTPQNSQDALDFGRKTIEDYLRDNKENAGVWSKIKSQASIVGIANDIAGVPYRSEIIPVRVLIYTS